MSDNYVFTELSSAATTSGHYRPQALAAQTNGNSLGQLSVAIQGSLVATQSTAPAPQPLAVEQTYFIPELSPVLSPELRTELSPELSLELSPELSPELSLKLSPELSPEQKLHMYLTVARGSQHVTVMENALALALRTQRTMVSATLSKTMPTALKIKTCEIPLLKLFLEFGVRSPRWRVLVVKMLHDNVETGCGHLTVNRAKQVLKELAKRAGPKVLANELAAGTSERRIAAIILLGWLKHEQAIEPLVSAYDQVSDGEKKLILLTLETHYLSRLAYHLKWRRLSTAALAGPLLALLGTA